jgi:glycosyltransferase involved in cell wall biosynthesis
MKLTACLIVKNEKDHIDEVLQSLEGVDEIVVCDTGSEDNTVELAQKYTDKVFTDYVWSDDFAEARNFAKSKCTGDWIISIDADEVLEQGGVEKIRKIIESAEKSQKHFSVEMKSKGSGHIHFLPRIFRNSDTVFWQGEAHETLQPSQDNKTDVVIIYGYSTAHDLDPDRMLRILEKQIGSTKCTPRDVYYFAREWFYRKDYKKAAAAFEEYVEIATWLPEKADALLYIARCYFQMQKGSAAREVCAEAVLLNPDFKEALLFMAELHFEPWKHKWERLAGVATNEDVLFVRT